MEELSDQGQTVQTVPAGCASKTERLYSRSNKFENGQVLLPRKASWLRDRSGGRDSV